MGELLWCAANWREQASVKQRPAQVSEIVVPSLGVGTSLSLLRTYVLG
jgi:hypothetical protein